MTRQIIRWQLQMPLQWSDRCTMWSHSCCDQFAEKWQSPSHGARVLGIPWNSVETDSWHSHASAIRPFSAAAIGCTAQIIQNLGQSCLTELCVPEVINAPLDVHILLLSIVMTDEATHDCRAELCTFATQFTAQCFPSHIAGYSFNTSHSI